MIALSLARTAVFGALLIPFGTASAVSQYTITNLGILPGGEGSVATDVNASAQVVGFGDISGTDDGYAFLYSAGAMNDLGKLPNGNYAEATALNDLGQVAGTANDVLNFSQAFIYSNGAMTGLGKLPGDTESFATGINNAGQVVGNSISGSGDELAFVYSNGVMTGLGTLGGSRSSATDINNTGQIVGTSWITNDDTVHAFIYSNGTMSDLLGTTSTAYAINDLGQVTGTLQLASGNNVGFLYSGGAATVLGTLGGEESAPYDINNAGSIVGDAYTLNGAVAFLYEGGVMYDLNSLLVSNTGWNLRLATGINDSGQIVGYGFINGEQRGFLLTPSAVPVPAAAWLFGSGLAGLAAFRRRKRREA